MTIKNLNTFKKKINKKMTTNARKNVLTAVSRGTGMVEKTAQESIKNKGTGRSYTRRGITHTASAPGQPPATDSGFLGQNITMNVKSMPNGTVVGQVISAAPYSKALEFGTTTIEARPFMQPALEKNKKKIVNIFKQHGIVK